MKNIEIIENNAGGLTIQNAVTKAVAHFDHKSQAIESLKAILDGDDMSGWDCSDHELFITDEEFMKNLINLRLWDENDVRAFIG